MQITIFQTHTAQIDGSFIERNPNLSYLLTTGGTAKYCLLVDASADPGKLAAGLAATGGRLEGILLTHYHGDHTSGLAAIAGMFPDATIYAHPYSLEYLAADGFNNLLPLKEGMKIELGDEALTVLETPGHTADSVSFRDKAGNKFFSGDVIFGGGIGCADYENGGNRNIFYQTVLDLLAELPPETGIYPGHYSEHRKMPPPYNLAAEKKTNTYLVNALRGKRGDFDRALKEFSIEFENNNYVMLTGDEIDSIEALEKATWIPQLQASRETLLQRLRSGHRFLAMKIEGELVGMVAWRYADFSIDDEPSKFPKDFIVFSLDESHPKAGAKSAFIYNVGVKATCRKKGTGSLLLQWAFEKIREDGIVEIFVDSRMPSYNGSRQTDHENIAPNPDFKKAIDGFFSGGRFPGKSELALDPTVRFYMANGFSPFLILRDFINDASSGNLRIICCLNMEEDNRCQNNSGQPRRD